MQVSSRQAQPTAKFSSAAALYGSRLYVTRRPGARVPTMTVLMGVLVVGSLALSILLTVQSAYTLYLMLYTWDRPEAYQRAKAPTQFLNPQKSYTVMLPARHEEDVIQTTIERVVGANYPKALLEIVVICKTDD